MYQVAILLLLLFRTAFSLKRPGCHEDNFVCEDTHDKAYCCTVATKCDTYGRGLTYAAEDSHCKADSEKPNKCWIAISGCYQVGVFFKFAERPKREWLSTFLPMIRWKEKAGEAIPEWVITASWAMYRAIKGQGMAKSLKFAQEFVRLKAIYDKYKKAQASGDTDAETTLLEEYKTKAVHILDNYWLHGSKHEINIAHTTRQLFDADKEKAVAQAKEITNFKHFESGWKGIIGLLQAKHTLEKQPAFKKWIESHPDDYAVMVEERRLWLTTFLRVIEWTEKAEKPDKIPKWVHSASWAMLDAIYERHMAESLKFANEFVRLKAIYHKYKKAQASGDTDAKALLDEYKTKAVHIIDTYWLLGSKHAINIGEITRKLFGMEDRAKAVTEAEKIDNFEHFETGWKKIIKLLKDNIENLVGAPAFVTWILRQRSDKTDYVQKLIELLEKESAHIGYDSELSELEENQGSYAFRDIGQYQYQYDAMKPGFGRAYDGADYAYHNGGAVSNSYNPLMVLMSLEIFTIFVVVLCMVGVVSLVCGVVAFYGYAKLKIKYR